MEVKIGVLMCGCADMQICGCGNVHGSGFGENAECGVSNAEVRRCVA